MKSLFSPSYSAQAETEEAQETNGVFHGPLAAGTKVSYPALLITCPTKATFGLVHREISLPQPMQDHHHRVEETKQR